MSYSAKAFLRFDFGASHKQDRIQEMIDDVVYQSAGTATASALDLTRNKALSANAGFREGHAVVILITDSVSQEERWEVRHSAELLRDKAEVFAIGVGPHIDLEQLKDIASEMIDMHVLLLTFDEVKSKLGVSVLAELAACVNGV